MFDYLPPELWPEIFLKQLPIRSLIQCTAVCKQWRSIITSPAFISNHLRLSRQNPLLLTAAGLNTFCFRFDTEPSLRPSQTLKCPFPTLNDLPFRFVGSIDGLILLSDDIIGYNNTMILWNPSIRKSVFLPFPRFNSDDLGQPRSTFIYGLHFGFGFDSATRDHKVVRIVYPEAPTPPLVEVYSLRDRSWRTVASADVDYSLVELSWSQCFIHGAIHWIGYKSVEPEQSHLLEIGVLVFDVGSEEFKKMALPEVETAAVEYPEDYAISVVGGLLSVFVDHVNRDRQDVSYESYTNIWVKTDYYADSWTKIASLDMKKRQVGAWLDLRRCCGDILREMGGGGGEADACSDIQVQSKVYRQEGFSYGFVFSYPESLVLLDEDTAVQEVCEALEKTQLGTTGS